MSLVPIHNPPRLRTLRRACLAGPNQLGYRAQHHHLPFQFPMLLCQIPRAQLLNLLPKGGEVAEIGVAEGDFSSDILANTAPRRLHLIDPWEHQERDDYANDVNNVADERQESRFNAVRARFQNEIAHGVVEVHRDYSEDAAIFFAAGQLDWIYVDGMHTEAAAHQDLTTYARLVKDDGFILGHDYTNHVQARAWNFGVVEAVNRFVKESGFEFVALTMEAFPTYLLGRKCRATQSLIDTILRKVPYLVEIRDFPRHGSFEHKTVSIDGNLLVFPSF